MQGAELRQLLQARGLLPRADSESLLKADHKTILVVQCERSAGPAVMLHFP
jgi:hypothetical protein